MSEHQSLSEDPGSDSSHSQTARFQPEGLESEWLLRNRMDLLEKLAGGIAHDFNNSLTVILSSLELARMLAEPGQELDQFLAEAEKAAENARILVKHFAPLFGRTESSRATNSLSGIIEESATITLLGSRITCNCCISNQLQLGSVDSQQLIQVIQNLVRNSKEAMPRGGTISLTAEAVTLREGEAAGLAAGHYIRFMVTDPGCGIPKEILPRIFDPYFSHKEAGKRKGLGLGLTACRIILTRLGGAISVESTPDSGTQAEFFLPLTSASVPGL